jgi:chromatin assembly factor 1 subunit B
MIWLGPRTASTSSLAAWTTLLASTTLRLVCPTAFAATRHETDNCTGSVIRQVAEHNHYVQGVAWDPLNEYIATQSSDRSVHVYTLKTKDGSCTLTNHNKISKMDMPTRRVSQSSPAPPDFRGRASFVGNESPAPSAPGTPLSLALPMNPPQTTHSRRSSFGSVSVSGQSMRRSVSPSPSMPLPAVMPSASPSIGGGLNMPARSTGMYANETFTSFFRRLTFAPDGSLLFTPAGQHKEAHPPTTEPNKTDDVANMTYIYTRAGLNKPPVAKLPGHRKPSLAVKCSPVFYTLRASPVPTKDITIDTHVDDEIPLLPEPVLPSKANSSMEPPPIVPSPALSHAHPAALPSPRTEDGFTAPTPLNGPPPVFDLPYRIVYAVATQDSVHVYDTQQSKPLCVVSNLHYATFTDLTW